MPTCLLLHLAGPSGVAIPLEAPHAALSARLDAGNHHARVKPFAIAPPTDAPDGIVIRVKLLDDVLGPLLGSSLEADSKVRLGSHFYRASSMEIESQRPWDELASHPTSTSSWQVDFRSPTTFRRRARSSPWPSPESITRSLLERWRALHPTTVPWVPDLRLRSVWVSDVAGESRPIRVGENVVSGFRGRICYVADDDAEGRAFGSLLDFAYFAGIGSHTAFGLGEVDTRPARDRSSRKLPAPRAPR